MLPRAILLFAPGLMHAAGMEGKVIEDHSGSAVASANVRIAKTGQRTLAADLETDREGNFKAPGLGEGDYRILVIKPNFVTSEVRLHLTDAAALSIRLVRCAVIRGRVADAEGRAIEGATVYAVPKPAAGLPIGPLTRAAQSEHYSAVDERGRFRVYNLPPGEYALVAAYGAYTMAVGARGSAEIPPSAGSGFLIFPQNAHPQWFMISGGEDLQNIDFSVPSVSFHKVSGKVHSSGAKGRYWLALAPADQPSIAIAAAQAEQDGSFHFDGIPDGSFQLFVSGPSTARTGLGGILEPQRFFAHAHVDVSARDVDGILLVPEKGHSATFTLSSNGKCSGTPQLVLTALEDWATMLSRTEGATLGAETAIADLAPSHYHIAVTGLEDCFGPADLTVDLSGGNQKIGVRLAPAASIRGKLDRAGFVAVLLAPDSVRLAIPDANGKFAFEGLRPAKYRIAARPAEASGQSRWIADLANLLEIDVTAGASIEMDLAAPVIAK
jgi:protocatechuate 3,4-dioxygenase beta subunit